MAVLSTRMSRVIKVLDVAFILLLFNSVYSRTYNLSLKLDNS